MAFSLKMNLFITIFIILAMCFSQTTSRKLHQYEASMIEKHEQWMSSYGRVYIDDVEKQQRFEIFKNNVEFIEAFNNNVDGNDRHYKLSINEFADLSNEEFKAFRNGYKKPFQERSLKKMMSLFKYENVSDVPSSMDWRKKGAVTPVKNQGQCGSCWAFSAIAATEGINQLKTGQLISLSEQELVDCDRTITSQGCNGGNQEDAFEFIVRNNGIASQATYPYKAIDGTCNSSAEGSRAVKINGYETVPVNDEQALLKAVANQPVSVSIDTSGQAFQFYSTGILTGDCGTVLDHGVTAVGYGVSHDGVKYWLVKNSWGTSWGENGYLRMQRDVDAKEGICGIAMDASYPTV